MQEKANMIWLIGFREFRNKIFMKYITKIMYVF